MSIVKKEQQLALVPMDAKRKFLPKGFTLVELLVVMALIVSLLTVGIGVFKSTAKAQSVGTGGAVARAAFDLAQRTAQTQSCVVRLYIPNNNSNSDMRERHLRQMVIAKGYEVYQPGAEKRLATDITKVTKWVSSDRGVSLPEKVYFNPKQSTGHKTSSFKFPGVKASEPVSAYCYEFNALGYLILPESETAADIVIQGGRLAPGADVPKTTNKKDIAGFRMRKNGKVSSYASAARLLDQLGVNESTFN